MADGGARGRARAKRSQPLPISRRDAPQADRQNPRFSPFGEVGTERIIRPAGIANTNGGARDHT